MNHRKIHFISPGCPLPSIALQVQNCSRKHLSFIFQQYSALESRSNEQEGSLRTNVEELAAKLAEDQEKHVQEIQSVKEQMLQQAQEEKEKLQQ